MRRESSKLGGLDQICTQIEKIRNGHKGPRKAIR